MTFYGRERRKAVSQAWAFGAYRWGAIWLIVAACASNGKIGIAIGLAIAAVDVMLTGVFKGLAFAIAEKSQKDWFDRLTNRLFYKLLWEQMRTGGAQAVDVDELFKEASAAAAADVKIADEGSRLDGFDSTAWHWFGGLLSFLWLIVSSLLYYGSALIVGSGGLQ